MCPVGVFFFDVVLHALAEVTKAGFDLWFFAFEDELDGAVGFVADPAGECGVDAGGGGGVHAEADALDATGVEDGAAF